PAREHAPSRPPPLPRGELVRAVAEAVDLDDEALASGRDVELRPGLVLAPGLAPQAAAARVHLVAVGEEDVRGAIRLRGLPVALASDAEPELGGEEGDGEPRRR